MAHYYGPRNDLESAHWATYLFSYRDSSCPPRSSWNASLSAQPGISYFRPTNLTPAGPSPSGRARRFTPLSSANFYDPILHSYRLHLWETAAGWQSDLAFSQQPTSVLNLPQGSFHLPHWKNLNLLFKGVIMSVKCWRRRLTHECHSKNTRFVSSPFLETPAQFACCTADWMQNFTWTITTLHRPVTYWGFRRPS